MDITRQFDSSGEYFDWVDKVIINQHDKVKRIIEMTKRGESLSNVDFLPTRYTLDGQETHDEWPNFQLDGYGTWL